jgi:tRNA-(ms[2]io[6]A)-hydroxylase
VAKSPRVLETLPADPLDGLPLAGATPADWAEAASRDVDALLADHAHCELKAASTAMSLAGRFGEVSDLVADLSSLAHEEMRHFERVHEVLCARGKSLPKVGPDRYVKRLKAAPLPKHPGTTAMLDALVLCGFVEARSCERFRLLARESKLPAELRALYAEFATAEARHHVLFFRHAEAAVGAKVARARIREVAAIEAAIVRELPVEARIH